MYFLNNTTFWLLRLTYGLVPIVAGLDKFTNFLVQWSGYLNPTVTQTLGLDAGAIMGVVGLVEIAAGVLVLTKWRKIGAYLVAGWLVLVSVNLLISGFYDIAVRDLVIAIGAFVLAQLTQKPRPSTEQTAA